MTSQSGGGLSTWFGYTDEGSPGGPPGGPGGSSNWPVHDIKIDATQHLIIPDEKQYILWQRIEIEGALTIEAGGKLVILSEGLPEPTSPDMTYIGDELSQIDYGSGEQKIFTYGGGDLTRVDFLQDGTIFRKDLFYSGGNLDYIDEYYI